MPDARQFSIELEHGAVIKFDDVGLTRYFTRLRVRRLLSDLACADVGHDWDDLDHEGIVLSVCKRCSFIR